MAITVLTNAAVLVGTTNLSDHVKSVKVTDGPDMLPSDAMGNSYHTFAYGLKNGSIEVQFYQDRGNASVDQTLAPLVGSTTSYSVTVYGNGTTVGATNPKWVVSQAQLSGDYNGINGTVGELEMTTVKFVPGPGGSLTRSTT